LGDFTSGTDQAVGTTASGGISVSNDAVAVNGSLNTAAGGIVSLTGEVGALTIASAGDITSDGAVNLTGATGISTAGDVTTTADLVNYNSATTLTGNVLVDTTSAGGSPAGATVTFGNTLNGAQSLGLTAGAGSVSFNNIVGGSTPLGTVTLTSAAGVTALSNFSAGTVTLTSVSGTASFAGNLVLTTGLSVGGGVNNVSMVGGGTIAGLTTFDNTGTVTIGDAAGDSTTFTAGVVATAPTAVNIGGTIAANTGASVITLGDAGTPVSVTATSVLGGAATGAITLGNATINNGFTLTMGTGIANAITLGTVSSGGAGSGLTLNTTGTVTASTVSLGTGTLLITQSGGTTFSGAVSVGTVTITDTTDEQTVAFQGNLNATTGMSVAANGFYNVSITGAANTIAGETTFGNRGTVQLGNGDDTIGFTGGVVATAPLLGKIINGTITAAGTGVINLGTTGVTVQGTSLVGGTSTGAITLGNATINNGFTLTAGTGRANAITLGTVSGTLVGAASNLTINTTGVSTVGTIGTDIGTVVATAGTLNVAAVTTSGAITVTADNINGTGIITSTAGGDITIRPLTANRAIGIGAGVDSGGLNLNSLLASVFTSGRVIIGSTASTGSGSGAITIGTVDLSATGYTGLSLLSQNAAATFNADSVLTLPTGTDIRFELGTGNVNGVAELNSASLSPNLVSAGGTLRFVSVGSVSLYGNVENLQTSTSSVGSGGLVYINSSELSVIGNQTSAGMMLIESRSGDVNLSAQLTGTKITVIADQNFNNTFGSTALNLQGGRGLVYSTNPDYNTPNSPDGGLIGFEAEYLVPTPNVLFPAVGTYTIENAPSGSANLMAYSDNTSISRQDTVTVSEIVQSEAYLANVPLTGASLPALPRSEVRLGFRAGAPQQRSPAVAPLGQVEKKGGTKGQSAAVLAPGRLNVSQMKKDNGPNSLGQASNNQPVIRIGAVSLRPSGDYLPSELAEVTMADIRNTQR
jgi:hypothetical protein